MKKLSQVAALIVLSTFAASACKGIQNDTAGPSIGDVSTSDKVVVISDCPATAVTISAHVTDESNVTSVVLRYRVGAAGPFASTAMATQNDKYTAAVEGSDLQGHGYGDLEFYITAEDDAGNFSKSLADKSIQFLPCVNN